MIFFSRIQVTGGIYRQYIVLIKYHLEESDCIYRLVRMKVFIDSRLLTKYHLGESDVYRARGLYS